MTLISDDELDFGKLLIINSKYNASEEEIKRLSCADSVRKIDWGTPAEDLLFTSLYYSLSMVYDVYNDDIKIDVFQLEGNGIKSMPLFLKDERALFLEFGANDIKALRVNLQAIESIEIIRDSIAGLYEKAKSLEGQMKILEMTDAAVNDLCDRIISYDSDGVNDVLDECCDRVRSFFAKKW